MELKNFIESFNRFIWVREKEPDAPTFTKLIGVIENAECAYISYYRTRLVNVTPHTYHDDNPIFQNESGVIVRSEMGGRKRWTVDRPDHFSEDEHKKRRRLLNGLLLSYGYYLIEVSGICPDGMDGLGDDFFLVVNLGNRDAFYKNIFKLSEFFNQDSYYYKAKNEVEGNIIGTNLSENPGYKIIKAEKNFIKIFTDKYIANYHAENVSYPVLLGNISISPLRSMHALHPKTRIATAMAVKKIKDILKNMV